MKDKGNRKNKGSLLKVMLLINSSFLLALTLFIILFSYHHYTEVIDLNQKKLYSEKLNTLVALCERKNERLERTGVPDAYRDDFQSQTLKQIADLNEDNDPRLRPIILNSTGDFLFPQNPNKKSSELIRYSFSDTQINSYSGKDEKTIYGISFKPWNWSILYSVPHSLKYEDRSKLLSNLLPISMLLFILISIVAGKLIRTKLQPISQLNQAAQSMAAGNLGITIHNTSGGEIADLADSFNSMRESISKQMKELNASRLNLAITLESIQDGVIATDSQGRIQRINSGGLDLLNTEPVQIINQHISDVISIYVNNEKNPYDLRNALQNGQTQTLPVGSLLKKKENALLPVSGNISPIINDKILGGFVMVLRDISEETQLREQLHQSQKMDAVGQLAGGIAHDFNNTLNGIIGCTEILKELSPSKEQEEYLNLILQTSEKAGNLSKQLLAFSRKGPQDNRVVELTQIILDSITLVKSTVAKTINIHFENDVADSHINGDAAVLQNSLVNIIINASQAVGESGNIHIKLCEKEIDEDYCRRSSFSLFPGDYFQISISDDGIGIKPEIIDKIFEPFFTTKAQGVGTGLGLSAVYGSILKHKGAIEVSSQTNKGTTFTMLFPETDSKPETKNSRISFSKSTKSANILLVDDEDIIRISTQAMLNSLGHKVETASNGKIALEKLSTHPNSFNCLILDMIMPVMGGKECFDQVRNMYPKLPIIIASGYAKDNEILEMLQSGPTHFLSKPYRKNQLADELNKLLQK